MFRKGNPVIKFKMAIFAGCDEDGNGGQEVPLPFSSVLISAESVDGKTALDRILEAAVAEQAPLGMQQQRNPDYKPYALTPEERGEEFLPAVQRSPEECLALSLRSKLMALHQQTVDREAEAKKAVEVAAKKAALDESLKVVQ